ncbi:MAG: UvrD-helicase domain-containing protein [Fimbriimonadaceae bacterium]|nr:UvrD-helicase domain-containing protein [Chitinophagales bacterium]
MNFLDELNEVQRQAVMQKDGPVMIIAGPGSGKTRVLTYRIAYLMAQGIDPFRILALTFTNKAAREMKNRIENLHGSDARSLWMGTFHSVFARILRSEADKLGYQNNFTIYDTDDAKNLLKSIVKEMGLNDKLYKPGYTLYRISLAKNNLIDANAYANNIDLTSEDEANGRPKMSEVYKQYAKRCFRAGAMDFDDLLLKTHELLERFPDVLYKYQHRFHYVMIDEFQDTNFLQYAIVKRLADVYQNICVVGDDAQSIYAFRGANILNILNYEKDFPEVKIFRLEQNYRSTKIIVEAANTIISKNKNQLAKQIWTENDEGERINVIRAMSDNEEGKIVSEAIFEQRMREHIKNSGFAILYRTNAQSRSFEEGLRKLNIPYRIYGGISFYQRKEIKDIIAYLKLTVNQNDEEAFKRIINYPVRGIGKTTIEKITVFAGDNDRSLWDIAENISLFQFPAGARNSVSDFVTMIKSFQTLLTKKDAYEVASHVSKSTNILKELYNDQSVEGLSRYENIQALLNSIKEFVDPETETIVGETTDRDVSLGAYLQQVSLLTDVDNEQANEDTVKLMTIHSAKGLEFESVFVVGTEENLFPSALSINSRDELEEERRLFYVAVTRAEKRLTITHAASRYRFGSLDYCEPSRFLDDLPQNLLNYVGYNKSPQGGFGNDAQFEKTVYRQEKIIKQNAASENNYQHKVSSSFTIATPDELLVGLEVEHQKFGFGKIVAMEGNSDGKMATIHFNLAGEKKLLLKFAKLSVVKG